MPVMQVNFSAQRPSQQQKKEPGELDNGRPMTTSAPNLSSVVCWTRMQAEAGQDIQEIVARKELERLAGEGLFFWGIGNAPSRSIKELAKSYEDIDVVFSLMKTRPKVRDAAPMGILAWLSYLDANGLERPVPPGVLVTSRMETPSGTKKSHYALMCWSDAKLRLADDGPFDQTAYRNVGETGGAVSHSQVTALLVRMGVESSETDYRINLRAKLAGSYWVRLARPCVLWDQARTTLRNSYTRLEQMEVAEWVAMISEIKSIAWEMSEQQTYLF